MKKSYFRIMYGLVRSDDLVVFVLSMVFNGGYRGRKEL